MRLPWIGIVGLGLLASDASMAAPRPSDRLVLVELFSSEGCSSCPPADELLSRLSRPGSVPGARVIGLEWHVDYWNYIGWSDPFSKAEYSARQQLYAGWFHRDDVYTPQMVVNGATEFTGSNEAKARQAIEASSVPEIALEWRADGRVHITSPELPPTTRLFLAETEDGLATRVERGENQGRVLQHGPVVRGFSPIERGVEVIDLHLPADAPREHLHVVVFAQDDAGHILAVGALDGRSTLSPGASKP